MDVSVCMKNHSAPPEVAISPSLHPNWDIALNLDDKDLEVPRALPTLAITVSVRLCSSGGIPVTTTASRTTAFGSLTS